MEIKNKRRIQKGWNASVAYGAAVCGCCNCFFYVPLFGWLYAFIDYKPGIPLSQSPFVGLKFSVF